MDTFLNIGNLNMGVGGSAELLYENRQDQFCPCCYSNKAIQLGVHNGHLTKLVIKVLRGRINVLVEDVKAMRMELIENGRKIISTNRGVFKDNELIWYDNAYVLSLKFAEEKIEIMIRKIPKAGGEVG